MAQNIELLGATYNDVPSVVLPKAGGGNVSFVDVSGTTAVAEDVEKDKRFILADGSEAIGTYEWNWMGKTYEWINSPGSFSTTLDETLFNGWTPSTTAKTIVASSNLTTFSADMLNYEYLIRWRFQSNVVTKADATLKVIPRDQAIEIWQSICRRPSNYTNLINKTYNGNACITALTAPIIIYYSSSGVVTAAYTGSYGLYAAATAATFSSSTSSTPTVTIKTPAISARCSTTYMVTARAAEIDQEESTVGWKCDLYRTSVGGEVRSIYELAVDLINDPLVL